MNARVFLRWLMTMGGIGLAWANARASGGYAEPTMETQRIKIISVENSAMLDATGKPYDPPVAGPGINYHSRLHRLLAHTYLEHGRNITFKTDRVSEAAYRVVIAQYPHFPFGYYALALTLRERRDAGWRDAARQAVEAFERTTAMSGCNVSHFLALKEMRADLAESAP